MIYPIKFPKKECKDLTTLLSDPTQFQENKIKISEYLWHIQGFFNSVLVGRSDSMETNEETDLFIIKELEEHLDEVLSSELIWVSDDADESGRMWLTILDSMSVLSHTLNIYQQNNEAKESVKDESNSNV